ncbi:penicillin-binding protein, partial [Saccharothrix sp. MB29]|nr:penicillin-binding protein [Saccharothrix sp. MB29]
PNPEAERQDLRVSQAEFYESAGNASFTLGPAPTNTLELANVAATIASGGRWCRPTPILRVTDRYGRDVPVTEPPCEQAVPEGLANALAVGLSEDDQERGTAAAAAKHYNWTRPALGKTGTTENHWSVAFMGATPQYAGAVMTFTDGVAPQVICSGSPPRLCGTNDAGGVFGGQVAAPTWFNAMRVIHDGKPVEQLPPVDP